MCPSPVKKLIAGYTLIQVKAREDFGRGEAIERFRAMDMG